MVKRPNKKQRMEPIIFRANLGYDSKGKIQKNIVVDSLLKRSKRRIFKTTTDETRRIK